MGTVLTSERESQLEDRVDPADVASESDAAEDAAAQAELAALVARCAAGEDEAWRQLLGLYGRRVFALCKSRVRGPELAEEITQSVFATVAIKLRSDGYEDSGRFEAWLFRIAMNRVRDEIRRQRRAAVPTDPEHFSGQGYSGLGNADKPDLGSEEDGAAELNRLRCAMDELGPADREVVELRHHGQMGFKEMADVLGEPMGTLLARHHRALKKLRTILERAAGQAAEGQA